VETVENFAQVTDRTFPVSKMVFIRLIDTLIIIIIYIYNNKVRAKAGLPRGKIILMKAISLDKFPELLYIFIAMLETCVCGCGQKTEIKIRTIPGCMKVFWMFAGDFTSTPAEMLEKIKDQNHDSTNSR
jgi:hypothetical protein